MFPSSPIPSNSRIKRPAEASRLRTCPDSRARFAQTPHVWSRTPRLSAMRGSRVPLTPEGASRSLRATTQSAPSPCSPSPRLDEKWQKDALACSPDPVLPLCRSPPSVRPTEQKPPARLSRRERAREYQAGNCGSAVSIPFSGPRSAPACRCWPLSSVSTPYIA